MGAKTSIEWTDATWNPTRGCSRVSPGCVNCYAERIAARFSKGDAARIKGTSPFSGFATMKNGEPHWTGRVELISEKLEEPLHWKKPRRIFVNSMSDLFHESLPDEAIDQVFAVMALCPQHTFQVLTKRAKRMLAWFNSRRPEGQLPNSPAQRIAEIIARKATEPWHTQDEPFPWPLPNIWLGVSVENQEYADERIPLLLQTPAAVRFVSYEPALGPVNFETYVCRDYRDGTPAELPKLDWIIAGGEGGPGARPPHPQWFRDVRDACQAAGVAFFFKQWGHFRPIGCADFESSDVDMVPMMSVEMDQVVRVWPDGRVDDGSEDPVAEGAWFTEPVGKEAAGALLDGREWREFPLRSA